MLGIDISQHTHAGRFFFRVYLSASSGVCHMKGLLSDNYSALFINYIQSFEQIVKALYNKWLFTKSLMFV